MTVTDMAVVQEHAAARRQALHNLAMEVNAGTEGFVLVATEVVPLLASGLCRNPHGCFQRLCDALAEFTRFCGSERAWLGEHCIPHTAELCELYHGVLEERIEKALDDLLAVSA